MPNTPRGQFERAKSQLRDATLEFEAAKASGDESKINDARRQMGEAFGCLVEGKQKLSGGSAPKAPEQE